MKKMYGYMWASLSVLFVLCCAAPTWASGTINFTENTSNQLHGKSDCDATKAIVLEWTLTPSAPLVNNSIPVFKVYIGDPAQTDKHKQLITFDGTRATSGSTVVYTGSLSSSRTGLDKTASKGLYASPAYLTVRDLIGFYRVVEQNGALPPVENDICKLEPASADTGARTVQICVKSTYSVTEAGSTNGKSEEATQCYEAKFDLTPPQAPSSIQVSPSEEQISVSWTVKKDYKYDVFVRTTSFSEKDLPNPHNTSVLLSSPYVIKSLSRTTKYYIALRTTDPAGNQGPLSPVTSTSTINLTDFYERYRKAGGKDKGFTGGFCFIATAAYGTYDHSYVQILRDFRDQYLLTHRPGKAFVRWYYANSPDWADWIRERPKVKKVVQALLLPLIAVSAFLVRLSGWMQIVLLLGMLLLLAVWRYRKRWLRTLPLAVLLVCLAPSSSDAKTPRNFGLELRAGSFQPQIDKESGLNGTPYKDVFGSSMRLYLETHVEWLVFKKFGSIGIGGSVGFTWAVAQALRPEGSTPSTDDTKTTNNTGLWIIPLRLDVSYRFDYFVHRNNIPVVPYIRGGLDYHIWFVTDPSGGLATDTSSGESVSALGARLGFHFAMGVQFLLDILDRRSARTFDSEIGVNHTYLFFEWNFSWVGVVTPGLNLSDSSFRAGLMFQF